MSTVPATSHFVVRDKVKLHHLDWGNAGAHPLVLVHGVRLHAHVWNDFARRATPDYHVLAVDQRGHGDSAWGDESDYHLEEFYRDLHAVVRARGLKRFTLVGHSLGGMVSLLYTHRHPEDVQRLVLVDISAGRPPVPPGTDLSRISETPPPRDFDSPEDAAQYLAGLMRLAPRHMVDESAQHGLRRLAGGRYTWKYDPMLLARKPVGRPGLPDFWQAAAEIRTPTLLQYGAESRVVTPELAERMRTTMPDCSVERIERAGHALFTDRPDAFAEGVLRFIAPEGKKTG
jgi:pimeloyl-ACP methyl ester carboxylesterase